MNRYGKLAQAHWARFAPRRYADLNDPNQFFTELGESVAAQISLICSNREQRLAKDLPYWEKVTQQLAIRREAEEIALADLVYVVPEPALNPEERLEEVLDQLPTVEMLDDHIASIQWELDRLNDEGHPRGPSPDEMEQLNRLNRLKFLLQLPESEQMARLPELETLLSPEQ